MLCEAKPLHDCINSSNVSFRVEPDGTDDGLHGIGQEFTSSTMPKGAVLDSEADANLCEVLIADQAIPDNPPLGRVGLLLVIIPAGHELGVGDLVSNQGQALVA